MNILNLLHLNDNFHFMSRIGQEIGACIKYYLEKNITPLNAINRIEINTERYLKIIAGNSCIRDEIRKKICGVKILDVRDREIAEHIPSSILKPLDEKQLQMVVPYF